MPVHSTFDGICSCCHGTGYISANQVKSNEPIYWRPLGVEICNNCAGSGIAMSEDILITAMAEQIKQEIDADIIKKLQEIIANS